MATPAKRLRASELVEQLLGALTRSRDEHSSVKLARNARGDTQIEVTVRSGESEGLDTIDAVAHEARRIYDWLRTQYPDPKPIDDGESSAARAAAGAAARAVRASQRS